MLFDESEQYKPRFIIYPPKYDQLKILSNSYIRYKGNSVHILAGNIVNYYHALSVYNSKGKFGSKVSRRQLLYAAAVVNSLYYLSHDLISLQDLQKAVSGAEQGKFVTPFSSYSSKLTPNSENQLLLCMIISLETIMFSFEDDIPETESFDKTKTILECLLDMSSQILTIIKKEMTNPTKKIFKPAKSIIKKFIKDKSFVDTIKAYK